MGIHISIFEGTSLEATPKKSCMYVWSIDTICWHHSRQWANGVEKGFSMQ